MGLGLLKRMMRLPESPAVSVAGVCAHEFGHILQYKHKLLSIVNAGQPSVKRGELQADYYAGYFAGLQKRNRPDYPAAVVALTQFNFGDTRYSDVQHHGTPSERGSAVVRGFEAAFHEKLTLGDSIQQSTNYVLKL
jgi:predicted metalloprotease